MAVQLSYPGVYVQEIPSGVRTITGVPTAITAFLGRAAKGQTETATIVTSFADYERSFGGLSAVSPMSFAVRDYYLNGGGAAVVVRLYQAQGGGGAKPPRTALNVGDLKFEAASEGSWGKGLRVVADILVPPGMGASMGVPQNSLFNLSVTDVGSGQSEYFANLTTADHASRVDRVLKGSSNLVRWRGAYPGSAPAVAAGKDAVSTAEDNLETQRRKIPFVQADFDNARTALDTAVNALGGNDGVDLTIANYLPANAQTNKQGLYALEQADLFNLLVIPPLADAGEQRQLTGIAAAYCEQRRAFMIVDAPAAWVGPNGTPNVVVAGMATSPDPLGTRSKNAALFWPRIVQPNPFKGGALEPFSPSGAIAGVFARTDTERGVWKAPAGLDAVLNNVPDLEYRMTDAENGLINPLGVNALRVKAPVGRVVYGSRTLQGDDRLGAEYKYIPVRRLALFIEESAYRGTQWAVFEPNDEPLWAQLRLNLGSFMHSLFVRGAFQGKTPSEAYFVKCDSETTTQNDVNLGIVNIVIGFAPLKPAEFVVISLKQIAGQLEG
ncbi:MAG TPA: phage tail sheath subtilisin-like domain-containing protein [Fimbriimonas sp.]